MDQVQSIRYRKKNKHLSFEERRTLEKLMSENRRLPKGKKLTKTAIAKKMGIHRSTLYRELKRGEIEQVDSVFKPYTSYSSDVAQKDYNHKATSKGKDLKIGKDHELAAFIVELILVYKYSPDAIVMNRHVLEDANTLQIVFSAHDNNHRRIHESYQIQNIKEAIIFHPNPNVDLAVVPIISLLEQFLDETKIVPEIAYLDQSLLPTEDDIKKLKTIEDVLVVGYPNGLWDAINNQPLVRRGITASDYKIDFNGEKSL